MGEYTPHFWPQVIVSFNLLKLFIIPMRFSSLNYDIGSEIKGLMSLGLPITVTQLLQVGYTTVAVIMAGRIGATELAAVGLGVALWIFVYLGCMGLLLALSPIVAQHHGAGHFFRDSPLISARSLACFNRGRDWLVARGTH